MVKQVDGIDQSGVRFSPGPPTGVFQEIGSRPVVKIHHTKMINYTTSTESITPEQLVGFFVGWTRKPNPDTHLKLLRQSDYVVLAVDKAKVVGFITAISDGILSAYIPFLEVLPEYQNRGIGSELAKRMLDQLKDFYMVDLLCDPDIQSFYKHLGMDSATGMRIRNYDKQGGKSN